MISQTKIDDLNELIREVGKKIKELHREIPGSTLTPMSVLVLKIISEKNKPTMKEVADCLSITPPSVTALIDPLVENRYILRDADTKDRRIVHLSLSDKGQQILKKNLLLARKEVNEVLNQMEEEEIDNLYSGMSHLLKILKKKK
jgi:MarR family 2-MHQ and catechol resistance regulon transcriptional repressor